MKCYVASVFVGLLFASSLSAQPSKEEAVNLNQQLGQLQNSLSKLSYDVPHKADAMLFAKAVEWALRHEEFDKKVPVKHAIQSLKLGAERVQKLNDQTADWGRSPGKSVLGFISRIDQSVQPYAVSLPNGFELKSPTRWPLHVVLHGRGGQNELRFIANHEGKPVAEEQTWIQIDIFGRIDNAYRWAGETDVFEAIDDVSRRYKIDEQRISLWGFSMGGAGAWHLGLHHPSMWASAGAGAGFVDFYEYQKQTEKLPEYQDRTLRIYDTRNYALNLFNVPFVTYGGELDKQLRSSQIMQEQAKPLGAPLAAIVGPQMGHKFDPESKKQFMEFLNKHNLKGRKRVPGLREIQFVTYTLKYNRCEWLTVEELVVPYERTTISSEINDDGELIVTTKNVSTLSIRRGPADTVRVDGSQPFDLNSTGGGNLAEVYFVKEPEGWIALDYDDSIDFLENPLSNKRHNLQGPIDDAFMESFICVTGTGNRWNEELSQYADWSLNRFEQEFDKWMRAKPVVIQDSAITPVHIRDNHLILFGDPGSNSLIAKVVEQLPINWTKDSITLGQKSYATKDHAVVLIYPNPLNPKRYVVINSGMTTHEKDFKASNSWLFPKLGDHAVIQFKKTKNGYEETTIDAGIFNSAWELE